MLAQKMMKHFMKLKLAKNIKYSVYCVTMKYITFVYYCLSMLNITRALTIIFRHLLSRKYYYGDVLYMGCIASPGIEFKIS